MNLNKKIIYTAIIAIGVVAGGVLVAGEQNINEKADELSDRGQIHITPVGAGENPEFIDRLEVSFSTGTVEEKPIKISAMSIRIQYPGDISGTLANPDDPFGKAEGLDENWEFAVNNVTREQNSTYLDLSAVYTGTEGFASAGSQQLAVIEFNEGEFSTDDYSVLGWNEQYVKMMTKQEPVEDIVQTVIKN